MGSSLEQHSMMLPTALYVVERFYFSFPHVLPPCALMSKVVLTPLVNTIVWQIIPPKTTPGISL